MLSFCARSPLHLLGVFCFAVLTWISSCAADPGDALKVAGTTSGAGDSAGTANGSGATGANGTQGTSGAGTASGASGTTTGAISGASGTTTGAISGASGTTTETASGASGTTTGTASGASGTTTGAISGASGATTGTAGTATTGTASGTMSGMTGGLAEAGMTETDAEADAGCLANIPSTCPDCATQNMGDVAHCKTYLQCFAANGCDPTVAGTACASNSGICGPNTIGGGTAPMQAAIQTYKCACQ